MNAGVPEVTLVRFGAGVLTVSWTADWNPNPNAAAAVTVWDGDTVIARSEAGPPFSVWIPVDLAPDKAYTVSVDPRFSPPSTKVPIVSEGPTLLSVTTEVTRVVTIQWVGSPMLASVQPILRWGSSEFALPPSPATTAPLVFTLPDNIPNSATVALRGIAGIATGPSGPSANILTVAPIALALSYDGTDVVATWCPVANPSVDRYAVTLQPQGQAAVRVTSEGPIARIPYAGTAPATVTVAAMASTIALGVASAPVDIIVAAPSITSAVYDGSAVRLTWHGAPDLAAHASRVRIESGKVTMTAFDVGLTQAVVALPPGPWTAVVQATGERTAGPGVGVALITDPPALNTIVFDPVGGDCTVTWSGPAGATGYTVTVEDGTGRIQTPAVDGTRCTIPPAWLTPGGAYVVTVRATASNAGQEVVGPAATAAVLAAAPACLRVTYDGASMHAEWDPVVSPLVTGYRVSSLGTSELLLIGDTTDTHGTWPLIATDLSMTVVVQALTGNGPGPASPPIQLFPTELFLGAGYLAPQTGPILTATDIILELPDLFAARPDPSKLVGLDPALGFTLSPAAAPYVYTLTIPASSAVWSFVNRVDVIQAWLAFVKKLQNPDLGASPAGIFALTEAVSRAMPQTFRESLYFAYGLQFDRGCFDFRPGIIIRVEYESYQFVGSGDSADNAGFVTTAVADYDVASFESNSRLLLGLDAFLGPLATLGVKVPVPRPLSGGRMSGGGGVIDTFMPTVQAPFVRVVYPKSFLESTTSGTLFPQFNAVTLAASTVDALEIATDNVRKGNPPGAGVAAMYLRGRTVVRPMVRVEISGETRLVPLGTTVGNVLAATARRPPPVAIPLVGVRMRRARAAAVIDGTAPDWTVRLDWSPGDPARLDLPLLHGDVLDLPGSRT